MLSLPVSYSPSFDDRRELGWKDVLSGRHWIFERKPDFGPALLKQDDLKMLAERAVQYRRPFSESRGSTIFGDNVRVTKDTGVFAYENEPTMAANPLDPKNLIVASHDFNQVGIVAYRSSDAGFTWSGPVLVPVGLEGDFFASDPGLAVNRTGTFFLSFLSFGLSQTGGVGSDVVVSRSIDGVNWKNSIAVTKNVKFPLPFFIQNLFYDKPYIAVGPWKNDTARDLIVVSFTEFVIGLNLAKQLFFANITIKSATSFDGGRNFSKPVAVSPTFNLNVPKFRVVQGSIPAVAADGTIYIAYYDSGEDGWLQGQAKIMVARSDDGGRSFSTPRTAAVIPNETTFYSGLSFFRWWATMLPIMAIGPGGEVYIVFSGDPDGLAGLDRADVYFVASFDRGDSWTEIKRVSDDITQSSQFFPWIAVGQDGTIHIIFGDRRLDPTDFGYDIFYTFSKDGGKTFSENMRVTDFTNNSWFGIPFFIGDYFNMAVTKDNIHVVWTDSRRGLQRQGGFTFIGANQDIYTASLGVRKNATLIVEEVSSEAGESRIFHLKASNLSPESPYVLEVEGRFITNLNPFFFADSQGNLETTFTPPFTSAGRYTVSVSDFTSGAVVASASFTLIQRTVLQIKITSPIISFPGQKLTFTIETLLAGARVNATIETAVISGPGLQQDLLPSIKKTGTGSFSISYQLPDDAKPGHYSLQVAGKFSGEFLVANGRSVAGFDINPNLIEMRDITRKLSDITNKLVSDFESFQKQVDSFQKQIGEITSLILALSFLLTVLTSAVLIKIFLSAKEAKGS